MLYTYYSKKQLKRFQIIIYNMILYHGLFYFKQFKNDYLQSAFPALHVIRV